MARLLSGIGAWVIVTLALACGERPQQDTDEGVATSVVARLGAEEITASDFREWLALRPGSERRVGRPGGARRELESLVELMLAEGEAEARGLAEDASYLAEQATIRERARMQERQLARRQLMKQIESAVTLDEAELRERYKRDEQKYVSSRIHLRRIADLDQETALELKLKLDRGRDFAELAGTANVDPKLHEREGDLGRLMRTEVPPSLRSAAFLLTTEGEVSEPFEADGSWNLLQLLSREPAVVRSFESVRGQLERAARHEKAVEEYTRLIGALRDRLGLVVEEQALAEIGPPAPRRLPQRARRPERTGGAAPGH